MEKIKVMICDDMSEIIMYFRKMMSMAEDMELVCDATNEKTCIERLEKYKPNVLLLDVQLNDVDTGVKILEEIKRRDIDVKVIMLTIHEDESYIFECLTLGACDYLLKSSSFDTVLTAIRNAYNNRMTLNPIIAKKLITESVRIQERHIKSISLLNAIAQLTATEYKILRLVYEGHSYEDIAKQRFVAPVTIRTQINKILKKFDMPTVKMLIEELKKTQIFDLKIDR